ncbi:MAG: phosphoribosylamine--glycine ligase [Melioribacteraceae bacterium]|nr:phosphoribosylamine--glycine ligase [Melioribacteraceae bacterium]
MNVAIIGSGGREHALALAISKSKLLDRLYVLPGNPGIGKIGKNIPVDVKNHELIIKFCLEEKVDLIVIGPEIPLIEGLTDKLISKKIKVFGPSKTAARLEGEKSFAKNLMKEHGIPTAAYEIFDKEDHQKAITYLSKIDYPTVIKADGIAAGKGVIIAEDFESAKSAIDDCFINSSFGKAGDKVVIEEYMTGQEASIFAITDGTEFILLPAAQDHKRIYDGDKGKNTGGMGAYAPTPFVDEKIIYDISEKIVKPTLRAMREKGATYSGCLYCGLMLTDEGPKVVEFNCRFGDPETQVVLPLIEGDFLELLYSVASGNLSSNSVKYNGGSSVCVVAASNGYPDHYETGKNITGIEEVEGYNLLVYHAGTKEMDGKLLTNGGRVLGVTSVIKENDLSSAKKIVYDAVSQIHFDGIYYRKDISDKAQIKI